GFSIWNQPTAEELQARQKYQDSVAAVTKSHAAATASTPLAGTATPSETTAADTSAANDSIAALQLQQTFGDFSESARGDEQLFYLENEDLKITFTSKGGRVKSAQLKKYKTYNQQPLYLFEGDSTVFGLNFFAQNRTISTNTLFFSKAGQNDSTLTLRLSAGPGKYVEYTYSIPAKGYLLGCSIRLEGLNSIIASNTNFIGLDWQQELFQQEQSVKNERSNATVYYKYISDDADHLSTTSSAEETLTAKSKWVSFKQQYFNVTLISDDAFEKPTHISVYQPSEEDSVVKYMKASFTLPYDHKPSEHFGLQFYFGPNHYQTLKRTGYGMEKIVPLGWGIFGWVNRFLVIPIFNFLNGFHLNYGLIILILTIAIKLLLLPLTYKAYISTAKMKVLKPEMEEIQAKHKDEPLKSQQELMSLYKKAGVSPFGGCLPMILQLPILIAMFRFFPASIELRQQSFLWAHDLSTYDSILDLGFKIPFYGDHVSLFTILMTISTIMYTYLNSQMTATNPQMKWMMYLMPIMFLGIFNNYSAGLSYYYFLANMISFGQQFLFRSTVDEKALHAKIQENKKRPQTQTKSKFQQRLEQMAKEQQSKKRK
ncbi:MAG TPA: membrane protein insertase YidC, partial [Bacteroidia bacterium]|nr:membrane protein insertase YidC [Bacteroidia bacterium]